MIYYTEAISYWLPQGRTINQALAFIPLVPTLLLNRGKANGQLLLNKTTAIVLAELIEKDVVR